MWAHQRGGWLLVAHVLPISGAWLFIAFGLRMTWPPSATTGCKKACIWSAMAVRSNSGSIPCATRWV